jgi:cytochrome c-type biogenesis protein CcmH/NrfG
MTNRIELFQKMLESDPGNTSVLFGLAKEYEKAGRDTDVISKRLTIRATLSAC